MTEFVTVRGKTKWFRGVTPETYKAPDGRVSIAWKHTLYPDKDSLEIIRDLQAQGMKNLLKKDEDGYYINFSRPTKIKRKDGTETLMDPPQVIMADGKTKAPDNIGNGSDVTTKLEVYEHNFPGSTKKVKAARWLASRIDNLINYERPGQEFKSDEFFSSSEQRAVKGLAEQPPQVQGWP